MARVNIPLYMVFTGMDFKCRTIGLFAGPIVSATSM